MGLSAEILLISPSADTKSFIRQCLSSNGFRLTQLTTLAEAQGITANRNFDLLIFEGLPSDASVALREIQKRNPEARTILISSESEKADPLKLLQKGAESCLFKPLREAELQFEIHRLLSDKPHTNPENSSDNFIHQESHNARMAELYNAAVEKIAGSDATVLILGESGTGKELMAKWIYFHSRRKQRPFVKVSCAVLPEGVLESELFGHEKGSFTGAYAKRKGRFELADTGTIFLDEIGDITPAIQSKFLRILQEREFQRIGSNDTIKVDVRVIAATSRDLWKEVQEGKFREDLYYRLNVISLNIPPLRDRREDIPALAEMFIKKYTQKSRKIIDGFDNEALDLLLKYDWPGNVRELENIVERAVVLSSYNVITIDDLPPNLQSLAPKQVIMEMTLKEARDKFEMDFIKDILIKFKGNISRSSEYLGLARKNLLEKLKKFEIDPNIYR